MGVEISKYARSTNEYVQESRGVSDSARAYGCKEEG